MNDSAVAFTSGVDATYMNNIKNELPEGTKYNQMT